MVLQRLNIKEFVAMGVYRAHVTIKMSPNCHVAAVLFAWLGDPSLNT
jgi:hypothetical protein